MDIQESSAAKDPQGSHFSELSTRPLDVAQTGADVLPAAAPTVPEHVRVPMPAAVSDVAPVVADEAIAVRPGRRRRLGGRVRPVHMPAKVHTFDSLHHRNYRLMWATTLFSSGGFWLQQIIIGWLTYELTQSAFLTTLAMGLDALPLLLAGPLGGVLVDSLDRRKLLAFIFSYQAVVTAVFAVPVLLGVVQTWHIFAFILTIGMAWVVLDPVRMTLIANTVPKHNLVNAFALNSLGFSVMRLAAPIVGGAMIAFSGPGPVLVMEVVMQIAAFWFARRLRLPPSERKQLRLSSAWTGPLEAARYIKGQPLILSLILLGIIPPFVVFPFVHGLLPVYAAEVYRVGPTGLGMLMSAVGAGSVVGTLALASVSEVRNRGRLIVASLGLTVAAMAAFSFTGVVGLAFPQLMMLSVGVMMFFSTTHATIQSIVPDEFRGRVSSLYALTFGLMPLGSLLAGVLAQRFGAPTATLVAAVVVGVVLLSVGLSARTVLRFR